MEARNEAASSVDPVVIRSGDIIVREGQIITNEIYEDLKLVGVLNQEKSILPGIGLALFILMIVSLVGYELNRLYQRDELDQGQILAVILISVIMAVIMKVVSLYIDQVSHLYLLVPIRTGVLLLKT